MFHGHPFVGYRERERFVRGTNYMLYTHLQHLELLIYTETFHHPMWKFLD